MRKNMASTIKPSVGLYLSIKWEIKNKMRINIYLIYGYSTERIFNTQVFTLYVIQAQCRDCYRLKPVFLG